MDSKSLIQIPNCVEKTDQNNQPTKKAKQKKDCNSSELVSKYYNYIQ